MSNVIGGEIFGGKLGSSEELSAEQQDAIAAARVRSVARDNWPEFTNLDPAHGGVLAAPNGDLLEPVPGTVVTATGELLVDKRDVAGFYLDANGLPVFIRHVLSGPRTVDELELERAEQRQARERGEHERLKRLERTPRSAVTAAELLDVPRMTLREAAYAIERAGGKIFVKRDGELVVELAQRGRARVEGIQAARLLFAAPELVAAAVKSKHGLDSLPSRELRAGGGIE